MKMSITTPIRGKKTDGGLLNPQTIVSAFFIAFFSLTFFSSCRLYKLEQKLDPVSAEFLSKVRYIITPEERKIFLELPAAEREHFREEFWKRRDYDPSTEENEFKMTYLKRIDETNELFRTEGRPGWMSDRGRIYILFGPPSERTAFSPGAHSSRCTEVWYYRHFPVVFVDNGCRGSYELITYDLTSIRSINLAYMMELTQSEAEAQMTIVEKRNSFDYDWDVTKTFIGAEKIEGLITIDIPYSVIWFTTTEDKLETTLDVRLELMNSSESLFWEFERSYTIKTDEEKLQENKKNRYHIEIPFILKEDLSQLKQGKNLFHVLIRNNTGDVELKKVMEFSFKE
jgi:GWxTD domain-containing protein